MIEITEESIKNQRVLIKTWKEIKKCSEKGLYKRSVPDSRTHFDEEMKPLCGTIVKLDSLSTIEATWDIAPWMVQEIIPMCKEEEVEEVEFYDKQPVCAWDDRFTHSRMMKFYDKKSDNVFSYEGKRNGSHYSHYEAIPDNMIPEWMIEAQKTLED